MKRKFFGLAIALAMAAVFTIAPTASVFAQSADLAQLEERIRYLEALEANLLQLEARQNNFSGQTFNTNDWNAGWGGWCWDADGNYIGPGACGRWGQGGAWGTNINTNMRGGGRGMMRGW